MRYKVSLKNTRTVIEYVDVQNINNLLTFYSNVSNMAVTKVVRFQKSKEVPLINTKDYFLLVSFTLKNEDGLTSYFSIPFVKIDSYEAMQDYIFKHFRVNSKPVKQIIIGIS